MIYVGVDGGGSTCRVRVRDQHGGLLGAASGGAANVYLDFSAAIRTIGAIVAAALPAASGPRTIRIGVGLAGVSSPAVAARVQDALAPLGQVLVTHDGDIACVGAHGGADGGLIIAGTGSGAVVRIAGASVTLGGRGFILGDDGSGARLGLAAMREALRAYDGLSAPTSLTRTLMARFADDVVAAIEWARAARSADFAALAPLVFAAAEAGDSTGQLLVEAAAGAIAELASAVVRRGAPRLSFTGGLAEALTPYLPEQVRLSLQPPVGDALDGALLLLGCPVPLLGP